MGFLTEVISASYTEFDTAFKKFKSEVVDRSIEESEIYVPKIKKLIDLILKQKDNAYLSRKLKLDGNKSFLSLMLRDAYNDIYNMPENMKALYTQLRGVYKNIKCHFVLVKADDVSDFESVLANEPGIKITSKKATTNDYMVIFLETDHDVSEVFEMLQNEGLSGFSVSGIPIEKMDKL